MDEKIVTHQIKSFRFVDVLRVTRDEFPLQFDFDEFFRRYRILIKVSDPLLEDRTKATPGVCNSLLQLLEMDVRLDDKNWWRFGNSKVKIFDNCFILLVFFTLWVQFRSERILAGVCQDEGLPSIGSTVPGKN